MALIEAKNLSKDYGGGRGVFSLDFAIERGETIGFVGENGAGKTTTIRLLMGFIRPTAGEASVGGFDVWKQSTKIKEMVSYIPGEIAFPNEKTGSSFLKRQADLLGVKDEKYCDYIVEMLQLDPTANLKRMSKGMKQKTAITAALMKDSDILILDEPTTGLDPLMRAAFINLIKQEKKRGKTIFMSSHIFEEVEDVADRIILLKEGRIISSVKMSDIKHKEEKVFHIYFEKRKDLKAFLKENLEILGKDEKERSVKIKVKDAKINDFLAVVKKCRVTNFREEKYTLEEYFTEVYERRKENV